MNTSSEEQPVYTGAANHFRNIEAVGGRLYLFKDRIEFRSHKLNFQNHTQAFLLGDIVEVEYFNTLAIIPNGLRIKLRNGEQEKFVVNRRKRWKEEIQRLMQLRQVKY